MPESSPSEKLIHELRQHHAHIGKNVYFGIGVFVEIENAPFLTIEDNVIVSSYSKIILHDSSLNNLSGFPILYATVTLKQNSYIGVDTLILPGTEVGENTIIGGGSLIKGKLHSNSVYFGRPARYVCSVDQLEHKWQRRRAKNDPGQYFIATPPWRDRTHQEIDQLEVEKLNVRFGDKNTPPSPPPQPHHVTSFWSKFFSRK